MDSTIKPIQPLWEQMPLKPIIPEKEQSFSTVFQTTLDRSLSNSITDIFTSAIDNVKETDAEKVRMEYLMATGQLDNPALLTIASTKAQLSVDLLVQLRNRALDAYNELMRISL